MITCPEPGALRAALDGERPDVAAHVEECRSCRTRSADHADDAAFVAARLPTAAPVADDAAEAALARVQARSLAPAVALPRRRRDAGSLLRVAASVLTVLLVGGLLSTSSGRAAAASFLERFRAERLAAVPVDFAAVDPAALKGLFELADVKDLDQLVDPQPVHSLDAAADVAGFTVTPLNRDALPAGFTGPVEVLAQAPQTVRITFPDRGDVPADIRGATLVLDVPGAVVQAVGGEGDRPVAIRGEAGSLEVAVEGGPTLAEVRDSLLSLPGLPAETMAALREIDDWETTLPLPVPVGGIAWSETTVAGRPALAFGDETGVGSVLLWHDGDRFVGVGGSLPLSQTRALAEGGE